MIKTTLLALGVITFTCLTVVDCAPANDIQPNAQSAKSSSSSSTSGSSTTGNASGDPISAPVITSSGVNPPAAPLTVSYAPSTGLNSGGTVTITAAGGAGSFTYTLQSGSATVSGNVVTMGPTAGAVVINVADASHQVQVINLTNLGPAVAATACPAGNVASCSGTGGTGVMTCAADGSAYSACTLTACNTGLYLRSGACTNVGHWVAVWVYSRDGISCDPRTKINVAATCTIGSGGCGTLSNSNRNGEVDSMFTCQ